MYVRVIDIDATVVGGGARLRTVAHVSGIGRRGRRAAVITGALGVVLLAAGCTGGSNGAPTNPTEAAETTETTETTESTEEPNTADTTALPFDVEMEQLGLGPSEQRCVEDGAEDVFRSDPATSDSEPGDVGDLTAAQHDELVTAVASVFARCVDVELVKRSTLDLVVEHGGGSPELIECWSTSIDDEWYGRYLADAFIHGEADDVFHGQQLAFMFRCGQLLLESMPDSGLPDEFFDCEARINDALVAELDETPERWRELTNEGANSARSLQCARELPAWSAAGDVRFSESAELFDDAVAEELLAQTGGGPSEAQAACLAGAMTEGIGATNLARSDPTAAEVVRFMSGQYSATELRFLLPLRQVETLAESVLDCVGTAINRLGTLTDGNILDSLGRPDPAPELGDLTDCAVARLDAAITRDFLIRQFVEGPQANVTPPGQAMIDNRNDVVVACADELGIEHTPPQD